MVWAIMVGKKEEEKINNLFPDDKIVFIFFYFL